MHIPTTHIDHILNAARLGGFAGGKALKKGQRMAMFSVSDLQLVSVDPREIVSVIRHHMDRFGMEEITRTWKSPVSDATVFSGPVETNDDLIGMLLTRKARSGMRVRVVG